MAEKRQYRTIDQVDEEYYRNHPDEIDSYLATAFEEYAKDGCTPALLSSLRMIARVKGVSALATQSGLTRNGIQKALSEQAKPGFDTINTIVKSMGYGITVQRLDMSEEPTT
ncbi:addiction module antidote protein (plasmid) [Thalassoporum mexicanum PCC 7367]|uniref:helix-turn-helix domain-containing transcriptional regulator n=1 Tax=Thalassoporum mexicanum TaxID=3457544 RepID=UPI00029FF19B|nr:addiction module antidote protein [Pseudanabaena sp. PCC 7367]AFY71941.1 addiction module antidote protein [Pseudanabaena sp. PCC 7367]